MVTAIALGAWFWIRQSKSDPRHALIYFAAITGALLGAKIAYLLSEGWLHTDPDTRLLHWLTGKSVTGALLGGWLAVELAKKITAYTRTTGDRYALIVPPGIILGRLGCLSHGCCQGIACDLGVFSTHGPDGTANWPAVPVEITFNFIALLLILLLRHRKALPGQHFHLYLFAYGLFRFSHEFLRATPKPFLGLSGYQLLSLLLATTAAIAFVIRARKPTESPKKEENS